MTLVHGQEIEGLIDNIVAWQDGNERLDTGTLFETMIQMYGSDPKGPLSFCALLLVDLYGALRDLEIAE